MQPFDLFPDSNAKLLPSRQNDSLAEVAQRREQLQTLRHEIHLRGPVRNETVEEIHCFKPISGTSVDSAIYEPKEWGVPKLTTSADPITGAPAPPPSQPYTPRDVARRRFIDQMGDELEEMNKFIDDVEADSPRMFAKQLPSAGTGVLSRNMPCYTTAAAECRDVSLQMQHWKLTEELDGRGDRVLPAMRTMTDREIRRENSERMREQIALLNAKSTADAQFEPRSVWSEQMPPMFSNCEVDGVKHPIRGNPNYPPHSPGWMHPSDDPTYIPVQLSGGGYRHEGWYNETNNSGSSADEEINSLQDRLKLLRSQVSARPKFAKV